METTTEARLRRLRAMLGKDCSEPPGAESISRQSDDAVEAVITHPDGKTERLRMSRGGRGGQGESSV